MPATRAAVIPLLLLPLIAGATSTRQAIAGDGSAPTAAIKVSQAGYLKKAAKLAFVVAPGEAGPFSVRPKDGGDPVLEGRLGDPVADADSGDRVRTADFTQLDVPGRYVLDVPGVGRSFEFAVGEDVLDRPLYLAMRSFYGQRCGTDVDLGSGFPGYRYSACHRTGAWHASSGRTGPRESVKGWHDAGDYGRYVVNSGITAGTLLWAFEMYGDRLKGLVLDIPESGNAVPDVLDEVRWNLEWMLSMQDPSDGGVWHKQTSETFPGFVMPQDDVSVSLVTGTGSPPWKGACASGDFAAVMAIAGRVYRPYDEAFAERAVAAAEKAWSWAERNSAVHFRNPPGVTTGAYGDRDCLDEILWGAAELWRTSGDGAAGRFFVENEATFRGRLTADGPPDWGNVAPLALWTYAFAPKADQARAQAIRDAAIAAADAILTRAAANGYRVALTTRDYVWGSNAVAANYGLQLLVADRMKADPRYVAAAADQLEYLLGRNTFSLSWVTRVGANPYRHPHHRPSGADANAEPWPGLLAGGPNGRKQDPAMAKGLADGLPPAKMYLDEEASYATNEVAINWNAPLVFLLAGVSR